MIYTTPGWLRHCSLVSQWEESTKSVVPFGSSLVPLQQTSKKRPRCDLLRGVFNDAQPQARLGIQISMCSGHMICTTSWQPLGRASVCAFWPSECHGWHSKSDPRTCKSTGAPQTCNNFHPSGSEFCGSIRTPRADAAATPPRPHPWPLRDSKPQATESGTRNESLEQNLTCPKDLQIQG